MVVSPHIRSDITLTDYMSSTKKQKKIMSTDELLPENQACFFSVENLVQRVLLWVLSDKPQKLFFVEKLEIISLKGKVLFKQCNYATV